MKYLVITIEGAFFTEFFMEPDWSQVHAIIDMRSDRYIQERHFKDDEYSSDWQEISEDHL